jgi:hypothetical protein
MREWDLNPAGDRKNPGGRDAERQDRGDSPGHEQITLPYAVSDAFSNFATVRISAPTQSMKAWLPSRRGNDQANWKCLKRHRQ